jgi:hypothetical protein
MNSGTCLKHTRITSFSPASTVLFLTGLEMDMFLLLSLLVIQYDLLEYWREALSSELV